MKAEITIEQVWYNHSLMNFFFRTQAEKTIEDFLSKVEDTGAALDRIEDYAEIHDLTLDDIEEMFYGETIQELSDDFDIPLLEEDEEDEDLYDLYEECHRP